MVKGYLVIVSCGNQKIWKRYPRAGATAARDAYVSSPFKAMRRYAEHFAERWLILSAHYGFIEPEFMIPGNYNVAFYDSDAVSVATLRQQVAAKDLQRFGIIGVLGSDRYCLRVIEAFGGCSTRLVHINGNVGFPPLFHSLINDLIARDTHFRPEDEQ